jgi:diacylglycerol kinase (ATP)
MPPALVIVNPASANGNTGQRWPEIERTLRQHWSNDFDAVVTEAPNHATEIARQAAGREVVINVGGDGTINEVLNGLMHIDARQRPTLALVQNGTGSDFARALGLRVDTQAAAERLSRATRHAVDVGEAAYMRGRELRTRYFVNIAGLGFDAEVSAEIGRDAARGAKGRASYFMSVFKTLRRFRNKRVRVTLTRAAEAGAASANGHALERLECDACMITVCNGRYFGGGMHVAPNADMRDGSFDVVIISGMSKLEFLLNFPSVYRGKHLSHPKVRVAQAHTVRIEQIENSATLLQLEAEGELLGEAPASFRLLPGALNVLV